MSAIGDSIAIVSLGLSCQSSRQIDAHVPLLRKLTGDQSLEKASLPFDWLISSPGGLGRLIESRQLFPETHEQLRNDQHRLRHADHEVLYWHESRLFAHAGHPGFADAKAKFTFTSGRFDKVAKLDRVIAVLSDTQSNLPEIEQQWGIGLTDTRIEHAELLRTRFAAFLGRPVEMLMVSRTPRPNDELPADFALYHMVPEPEGWTGNAAHWAKVFTDYFG